MGIPGIKQYYTTKHNTSMTNHRNTVKFLLTLHPVKINTNLQYYRPWPLRVLAVWLDLG